MVTTSIAHGHNPRGNSESGCSAFFVVTRSERSASGRHRRDGTRLPQSRARTVPTSYMPWVHASVTSVGFTKKRPACSLIRSESESDARRSWFHPRRRVGNTSLQLRTTTTNYPRTGSTAPPDYSRRALELDGDTCSPKGFSLARATGAASLAATPRSSAALRIGRSSRSTVRCTGAAHAAAGREAS